MENLEDLDSEHEAYVLNEFEHTFNTLTNPFDEEDKITNEELEFGNLELSENVCISCSS
jgi:hypothetical protein